jgi:hypothetical protein
MNYYTVFYLIIILFIIFKNDLFSKIIDFNTKNNTGNITKRMFNITKRMFNNTDNIKKLTIILITCYLIYNIKIIYKCLIFIFSLMIYLNYTKINYILNQFVNIYYDNFLINKFMLI